MSRAEQLISVDVEAGGPVPALYPMLSIGACVVDDTDLRFYIELRPEPADHYVGEAVRVGWPDATAESTIRTLVAHAADPEDAMRGFEEWISRVSAGCTPVFVGFNATFDWMFVNWYFHRYLGRNPFGIAGLDIKAFWAGRSGASWRATSKSRLPHEITGDLGPHTHRADDDAVRQALIFRRMRAWQGPASAAVPG